MRLREGRIPYGEKYDPAMLIEDPEEAAAYFEARVEHQMRIGGASRADAERIERHNIGYYSGYYSRETRARVERVFGLAHPIFGPVQELEAGP